jgi:hypothetical protein
LLAHDRKKEFWNEVVIFSNKDDNLSKSHIKYLESRLEGLAKDADRYKLDNGNSPTQSNLSRSEREAMEELLEDIRLFLGTLGYPILEPLIKSAQIASTIIPMPVPKSSSSDELKFTVHNLIARGVQADEGFVLKKGSTASRSNTDTLSAKLVTLKKQLIADGRLVVEGDHLRLTEDLLMSSSSYAAALIAGTARGGPQSWHTANGKILKELEDQAVKNSETQLTSDSSNNDSFSNGSRFDD